MIVKKVAVHRATQGLLSEEDHSGKAFRLNASMKTPWRQNIAPNRNCFAGPGLRDDQIGWFSRLQWLNGGRLGEMGKSLRSSHRRADMHFRAGA